MKFFKKVKKGFTLVELVVVIAVVAVLAAVSVGAYFGIVESAKEAKLKQEAEQIHLAMRIISLDGDPNQTLKRDGLLIADGGLDEFENQLSHELGWDGLEVTLQEPTEVKEKLVYLYTESDVSAQDNSEILYVYFNYYTREALGKKAKVNIIGGEDIGVSSSDVKLAMHECGVHTIDTQGDHSSKYACGHYVCTPGNHEQANCGVEGHYNCDTKNHTKNQEEPSCYGYHQYSCQCKDYIVPENTIKGVDDAKLEILNGDDEVIKTLSSGESFGCSSNDLIHTSKIKLYLNHYIYSATSVLSPNDGYEFWNMSAIVNPEYKDLTELCDMEDEIFGENKISLQECFSGCKNLIEAPHLSRDATNYWGTFSGCTSLKEANFTFSEFARTASHCFSGCKNLITGPSKIPGAISLIINLFYNCEKLEVAPIIEENVVNLSRSFYKCTSLKGEIKIPNTATNLDSTFFNCINLESVVSENNFENVTNFNSTFYGCYNLKCEIKLSNSNSVNDVKCDNMFEGTKDIAGETFEVPNYVIDANGMFYNYQSTKDFSLTLNNNVKTFRGIIAGSKIEGVLTININGFTKDNINDQGGTLLSKVIAEKVIIDGDSELDAKIAFIDSWNDQNGNQCTSFEIKDGEKTYKYDDDDIKNNLS